ncbi:MAG TPA: excinuclease ABC subunit UvrC [Deltaproteobacteria bacterium]|jgi:excinuclease ABC subunit C|nr:excinuclease ABC subunit UvrC [Deltaproteobacteria bacterium]
MALNPGIIADLPRSTGVYLMKNALGEIIYVGKAKDLRSRVYSYLGQDTRPSVPYIADQTDRVDFIVTRNEKEALFLENQLIKSHRPRFNVDLKDDKSYVRIKITVGEEWPRVSVTRKVVKDGSLYFGPYASAHAIRTTLSAISRIFPLRRCKETVFRNRTRPCMYHQIGLCSGPCGGKITKAGYDEIVSDLVTFLEGKDKELKERLKERMQREARNQNYETAAKIRDQIHAIEVSLVPQVVVGNAPTDVDIFGTYRLKDKAQIAVLHISRGTMTDSHTLVVHNTDEDDFMTNSMLQFYLRNNNIPPLVYADFLPGDREILEQILSDLRGSKVSIRRGVRGKPKLWVEMAQENARSYGRNKETSALDDLAKAFSLSAVPYRMECYDISSFQGSNPVASRVVFMGGAPDKTLYRHYRIRDIEGQDDYAMMEQVLRRRLAGDEAMPDLLIIDGGKGQLNVCTRVLESLGMGSIPVVAMAKPRGAKNDRFFFPGRKDAVFLPERSEGLRLMQRIRDEAHRFAVKYHTHLRSKAVSTVLEEIPGIGPKKARCILKHTAHLSGLSQIGVEDLEGCPSITKGDVERIIKFVRDL